MYVKSKVSKGYQDNWWYEILNTRKDIRRLRKGWREQRCHRNLIRCPGDQRLSECPSHRRRTRDLKRYFRRDEILDTSSSLAVSLATKTGNIWRVDIKRMKSIDKQLMRRSRRRQFFFFEYFFYVVCSGQERWTELFFEGRDTVRCARRSLCADHFYSRQYSHDFLSDIIISTLSYDEKELEWIWR